MKAGVIFTGTGPILIVTSRESLKDPRVIDLLRSKGIDKFIGYEVSVDVVREKYGQHFTVTMGDRQQSDDLRVMDEEGQRVFHNFPLNLLGNPVCHEELTYIRKAA